MYLGIDCGGTHLRIGLINEEGQIIAYSRIKSPLVSHPDNFGQTVITEYQQLANNISEAVSLQAIGVGVPGPIDRANGSILHSANLHNDLPIHFVRQLREVFSDVPIAFDRDAEVALWGEYWQGVARDCANCLLLTLGTGIGGAIMVDHKVMTGVSDNAGEIGHMYLSLNLEQAKAVPTCGLGHQGCFEAWFKSATKEDKPYVLGIGLASLVDIFNPGKIILGGGVIEFGEIDLAEAIEVMKDKAVSPLGEQTQVIKASLGDKAGVVGAAYLAKELLAHPE